MAKRGQRASSGPGWSLSTPCPACGRAPAACRCGAPATPSEPPTARLRLERRRGKPVTVCQFSGAPLPDLRALGRELKNRCSTGGTAKDTQLELQGDHREAARALLRERGFAVRG